MLCANFSTHHSLVSCTNSRFSDFEAAAKVFKDAAKDDKIPKIADGVQLVIAAASKYVQEAAEASGDWQVLLDAGAIEHPPGCSACIGLGNNLLEEGETGISASNRNFPGRMGHRSAQTYLSSPEVVAASALSGYISGPGSYEVPEGWAGVEYGFGTGEPETTESQLAGLLEQMESLIDRVESSTDATSASTEIQPGFPEKISGEIVFCDADNLNTDGIYPGSMTYRDDATDEEMAKACMQNYDPNFSSLAKPSDILVSGFNFGCGSSREQACTSILKKQIPLVVAGSLGNVFSRNCINNALIGLQSPRLIERLREHFSESVPTRRTGWTLTWDVKQNHIEVKEADGKTWTEKVGEIPASVQAIITAGGLEAYVQSEIAKSQNASS